LERAVDAPLLDAPAPGAPAAGVAPVGARRLSAVVRRGAAVAGGPPAPGGRRSAPGAVTGPSSTARLDWRHATMAAKVDNEEVADAASVRFGSGSGGAPSGRRVRAGADPRHVPVEVVPAGPVRRLLRGARAGVLR